MYYDDINQYIIKVRYKNLRTYYVKFIDWEAGTIEYTKEKYEAGSFEPYSRALEIAEFLENEPNVLKAEVVVI